MQMTRRGRPTRGVALRRCEAKLPEALALQLDEAAARTGIPKNRLIEKALSGYLPSLEVAHVG